MLVQGARVEAFEEAVAQVSGRAHAVAVSNGTSALELALRVAGVGAGDEVLVPALTWPSPAHAARVLGARVVAVDVDPAEWNSTGAMFARARGERTKAAIVIDQFGNPARRAEVMSALDGVAIIEDAACALGASFEDATPCGSLGHISCTSFHPRKVVTTGEGGMCLTDDPEAAATLRMLRNHGQRTPGAFGAFSGNYRLTDIQGAMGTAQMARLDEIVARRRSHAATIRGALSDLLEFQRAPDGARANHQTLGALLPPGTDGAARDETLAALRAQGVGAGRLSYVLTEISTVGASGDPQNARDIASRGIALPLYPQMDEADVGWVIDQTREVLTAGSPPASPGA